MSKEKAKEFYEFSKNDDELQERLKAANSSATVIQIASEKGYEFTESEWEIAMQDAIAEDELSEEELLAVAGAVYHQDVDLPDGTHIHTHA
ncbi:Nif11-like leader peptide family natural product precursor [Nostoc sp. FACHB-892]|nr:Nif11-like leader peptide family natural product precursor [Nostoc sp. FACHB-892]